LAFVNRLGLSRDGLDLPPLRIEVQPRATA
jgi:hypothetical protein